MAISAFVGQQEHGENESVSNMGWQNRESWHMAIHLVLLHTVLTILGNAIQALNYLRATANEEILLQKHCF